MRTSAKILALLGIGHTHAAKDPSMLLNSNQELLEDIMVQQEASDYYDFRSPSNLVQTSGGPGAPGGGPMGMGMGVSMGQSMSPMSSVMPSSSVTVNAVEGDEPLPSIA